MVEVAIARAESFAGSSGEFSPKVIDDIVEAAVKMFDPQNGGFGNAPKFPHPAVLDLLIDQYARIRRRKTARGLRPDAGKNGARRRL